MIYRLLKFMVRMALPFFCRKIVINKPEFLKENGPLLLACNHPNSFLDAVILDTIFKEPIWSLARGDVFKSKFIIKLLTRVRILPIYRVSEGAQHLGGNYQTFDDCKKIFRDNGVVMIFSEGKCINEWHLRPLRKGTARLALSSWEDGIPLKVLPVGINYSSFQSFGKTIILNFGTIIENNIIPGESSEGVRIQAFNEALRKQLQENVYEIDRDDIPKRKQIFNVQQSFIAKVLLAIPAILGWIFHAPLFIPVQHFTGTRALHSDHYDSVLLALLLFLYPLYLLLLLVIVFWITGSAWAFSILAIFPLTALAFTRMKNNSVAASKTI